MSNQVSSNKRIIKNTTILYVRMLFLMMISLYTSRLLLSSLGVTDFGIYNVVGGFVAIFAFLNNSMASATQRFLTFALGEKDFIKLKEVFATSVLIHILIAVVVIIFAETIGLWFVKTQLTYPIERENAVFWVYQCSVFSCAILFANVPFNAVLIAHEKMDIFAYISILEIILRLLAAIIISSSFFDNLVVYAILIFVIQVIIRVVYGICCKRLFPEVSSKIIWNRKLLTEMFTFASWSLWGNLSSVATVQGVNVLLNIFFGPAVNAARGISVQVQSAINSLSANFQSAMNPQITKSYAQKNLNRMHNLVYSGCKYSAFLLLILAIPIIIETNYILSLWLENVPPHTNMFVRLSLITGVINSMSGPLVTSANATGKIRVYQSVIGGILLCDLPVSFLMLKILPYPEIVFIVQMFICLIANFVRLFIVKKMIDLSAIYFMREVVFKVLVIGGTGFIVLYVPHLYLHSTLFSLISLFSINLIYLSVCIYFFGLNRSEREFVYNKIVYVLNRK